MAHWLQPSYVVDWPSRTLILGSIGRRAQYVSHVKAAVFVMQSNFLPD